MDLPISASGQTPEEVRLFYDDRYSKGYMDNWDQKKKSRVFKIIRDLNLPKSGRAIDFGCGNGVLTDIIKKALPTWEVFGTDISSQAISNAKRRFSHLNFFELSYKRQFYEHFDFLFSHHVLEHVFDMDETWNDMSMLLKKSANMLHILPCGNTGSFEHRISLLVRNGVDKNNGRYFFEEPGHLRRLNTEQMNSIAKRFGFCLRRAYYRNHYLTSIEEITASPNLVLAVTNPGNAKSQEAAIQLEKLRSELLVVSILRLPARLFLNPNRIKHFGSILLTTLFKVFLVPICAFSFPINFLINIKAEQEWNHCKDFKNGSEMYLYYNRVGFW